jgi:hypothetical protein
VREIADGAIDPALRRTISVDVDPVAGGASQPPCPRSADADDSGGLDITDAIHLLTWLFLGGPPPEDPLAACGHDPTPDDLGCPAFAVCP